MSFRLACCLNEVIDAWRMVYMAYRCHGLIDANEQRLHTAPQAVGRYAAVITGGVRALIISTLTAMADGPLGLPLDRVYAAELQSLRRDGRRLLEVGLFADRRLRNSTADTLFELMRYVFYYSLSLGVTDVVIGVHPRHARFYRRAFGFDTAGMTKVYPAVNNRPVVLLRANLGVILKLQPLHPGLDYFVHNPLTETPFTDRYTFDPREVEHSTLGQFLHQHGIQSQHRLTMPA